MLYRKMKTTGDELSILGYGLMRLPLKGRKIDEVRATAQLRHAIDQGVNYVDTAMPYHMGASEPFLGKALGDGYRERVKVATKLPPWSVKEPADMDRLLNLQLDFINTDHIDYYLVHSLSGASWQTMYDMGVIDFLERAKKDGRVTNVGFSFHGDIDAFRVIVDAYDWSFCQIQYNFLDENNQAGTEGLEYAAAKELGIIVMEPLRGGNLCGKIPAPAQQIWDEAAEQRSPAEWALRWIWNRPEVTLLLSGMNEEAHIDENIRIAGEGLPHTLTGDELALVDRVKEVYRGLTKADCTGCRYCMPCKHGVKIPECFEVYNHRYMFDNAREGKFLYMMRVGALFSGEEPAYASKCEECGECEEACPQGLPIQDLMKDISGEFEGTGMKVLAWVIKRIMAIQRWGTMRKAKKKK
jgi:hypothetical protein